jgi:protein-tyrosine phosphatase
VIDLHAHILPGLDDGPVSLDAALEMARVAAANGTRAIATTSHIDAGFGLGPDELARARSALAARLADEGVELELLGGGEVAPARLPALDDETLAGLTLGEGPYVLLECPFSPVGAGMRLMVADLHRRGFEVLLAHPERSPTFQREPARLEDLVRAGALAQVTTVSLTGGYGAPVRRAAVEMLERGLVHVLATDAHDVRRRPPDLRAADGVLDGEQREWMTRDAPAAIVAGEPLPPRPPLRRSSRVLDRLRRHGRG